MKGLRLRKKRGFYQDARAVRMEGECVVSHPFLANDNEHGMVGDRRVSVPCIVVKYDEGDGPKLAVWPVEGCDVIESPTESARSPQKLGIDAEGYVHELEDG